MTKKIFILSAAAAVSASASASRWFLWHCSLSALLDVIVLPADALAYSSSSSSFPRKAQLQQLQQPAESSESNKIRIQKPKFSSSLLSLLQERNSTMSQTECDALLADFVTSNDENHWKQALDWVQTQQALTENTIAKSTYDACLQACLEHSQHAERAVEILALMSAHRHSIKPNAHQYSLCIRSLCRKQVQEQQQNPSSSLSSPLWRQALTLQQQFGQSNQQQDLPIAVYDAILTCMVHDMAWKDALRLLHQLQQQHQQSPKKNTQPAASTYRIVIECCVAANQSEQALQVLQSCIVASTNHQPTTYAFELVMLSLCRNRQWRRARSLLDDMERLDVPRNLAIYNALLQACQRAGEMAASQQLLTRLELREPHSLQPSVRSYNAVMAVCAATSHWTEALAILDRIHRAPGVEPDLYSYTNAIRACAKVGKTARALALFQVVKDKELALDSYLYTAVIEACLWQQALELLIEMENKGIEPSEVTYSVAIKACGAAGQWQKALELLETMRNRNMPINLYVYNAAITAVSKAAKQRKYGGHDGRAQEGGGLWTRVMTLLDTMHRDGIEPDGFSFASAISCCGSEGRWEEALQLMDVMEKRGTRPNKVAYTAAIASCGRAGQVDHAMRLFRQMKEQCLSADRVAYNALFTALRIAKRPEAAYELWQEMLGTRPIQKSNNNKAALATSHRRTNQIASARQSGTSLDPDIITVTDAIGAMSSGGNEPAGCDKVDDVFEEAVRRGIVLRSDSMDTCSEFDLSGMSLPVARAAVRFLLKRLASSAGASKNLSFITGVGRSGRSVGGGSTALREYVQEILLQDFHPGLPSTVPKLAQGTVEVSPEALANWRRKHK